MKQYGALLLLSGLFLGIYGCSDTATEQATPPTSKLVLNNASEKWADYWYQGEAEINSYRLTQQRYGQRRTGSAVLVFVTEPFGIEDQVKLDDPSAFDDEDKKTVLKLNRIHRFTTGIYDYSLMQSVFTPVNLSTPERTLKTTTTVQDWCGQTFSQLNARDGKYEHRQFSYFEKEGDLTQKLPLVLLEDELFSLIRMNPAHLQGAKIELLPGQFTSTMFHEPLAPKEARIRFINTENHRQCMVEYLHADKTLQIDFKANFPFTILGWKETINNIVVTEGQLISSIKSPYWQQNGQQFEVMRDSLQLNFF